MKIKPTVQNMFEFKENKLINKNQCDLKRFIKGETITRKGLELAGVRSNLEHYSGYVVGWGTNEYDYIKSLDEADAVQRIEAVLNLKTPAIILSSGFKNDSVLDLLMRVAEKLKIPVYHSNLHMSTIFEKFHEEIKKYNCKVEVLHASFVVINDVGVLIRGKSGIGKSESVLEIIQREHTFIGDDSIEAYKDGDFIFGRSSIITKDLLEVRGIGLINIPFIYGKRSVSDNARIDLIVELVSEDTKMEIDRLGNSGLTENLLDKEIQKTIIPIKAGRSISSLIIAAAAVFSAKKEGMDPIETIKKRQEAL